MGFTLLASQLVLRPVPVAQLTDSSSRGSLTYLCSDCLPAVGVL